MERVLVNATDGKCVEGLNFIDLKFDGNIKREVITEETMKFIELTEDELDSLNNIYALLEKNMYTEKDVAKKKSICEKAAVVILDEFTSKFVNPTILVDNEIIAKNMLLIVSKKYKANYRPHVLYTDGKFVLSEALIMEWFSDTFYFDAEKCDISQLKNVCQEYRGLSSSFDKISDEVLTFLQLKATITSEQKSELLGFLELALKKKIICSAYIDLAKEISSTIKYCVFQATKYDYDLCLAQQYKIIKPLDSEKEKIYRLVRIKKKANAEYDCKLKNSVNELLKITKQKNANMIVTDNEDIFKMLKSKGITVAFYESSGNIIDKNGVSLERASAILNLFMCHKI